MDQTPPRSPAVDASVQLMQSVWKGAFFRELMLMRGSELCTFIPEQGASGIGTPAGLGLISTGASSVGSHRSRLPRPVQGYRASAGAGVQSLGRCRGAEVPLGE